MKMMVKLAVFLATLLLLTGAAFAQCDPVCYDVTATNLDNPANSEKFNALFCFGYDDIHGSIDTMFGGASMSLFFDRHPDQALAFGDGCVGYFKFHEWVAIFNGVGFCDGDRWKVRGLITDLDNCVHSM